MYGLSYKEAEVLSDIIYTSRTGISSPDIWSEMLEKIGRLIEFDSAAVTFYGDTFDKPLYVITQNLDPNFHTDYRDHFYANDPTRSAIRQTDKLVYRPEDLMPLEDWRNTELYTGFLVPHGCLRCVSCAVGSSPVSHVGFHLMHSDEFKGFTDRDVKLLEIMQLHFASAFRRDKANQESAGLMETIEDGLDYRPSGVFVFDEYGRTMHINRYATYLCRLPDLPSDAVMSNVKEMLSRLIANNPPIQICDAILDLNGKPYRVMGSKLQEGKESPCYFIRVMRLVNEAAPSISDFAASYGLSSREAEICHMVAKGYTNRAIAESLFISELTVKDHLKHIFHKLHISRRGEIIAKMIDI